MTTASKGTTPSIDTPNAPSSLGRRLHSSAAVDAAVRALGDEVRRASAQITDVRPADPSLKASYDAHMARAAVVRGRPLLYPYVASGLGNGALVELDDGSVKWDMISGIGVHFFGHSDVEMIEASIRASLGDTVKQGNLQADFSAHAFAEVLLREAANHSGLKYAYLSTSGAMANENALKVCFQKHAPASRVIAFADCFMGRSTTMAQIGDSADGRVGIPLNTSVDYMPFYDAIAAERMGKTRFIDMALSHLDQYIARYPGQHACFIFELIQGEGGFNVGEREFFRVLMERCKAAKIAVWDDEIQTFGRTPRMFAYEYFDLGEYVDVFCVGKMTQVCATLFTEQYSPKAGLLSGTFVGEGVSFAVGQRVIERLRDGEYYGERGLIARHHQAFRDQTAALMARHPAWFPSVPSVGELVGGLGGMMRMTPFGGAKDKITNLCKVLFEEGVITFYCGHGPYHLRVLPPLGVMKLEDWPRVFACIERGLARVAG